MSRKYLKMTSDARRIKLDPNWEIRKIRVKLLVRSSQFLHEAKTMLQRENKGRIWAPSRKTSR